MLTAEHLRGRVVKGVIQLRWVDPDDRELCDLAERLGALHQLAADERWSRRRLDEELLDFDEDVGDPKLVRGLARLLMDRCTLEASTSLAPAELRQRVFLYAATRAPLGLEAGPDERPTAADVLRELGLELDLDPAAISRGLYADQHEEQVLCAFDPEPPVELLHRYNLALAQAVLARSLGLKIRLQSPDPKRVRQLLRLLKFRQLMLRMYDEEDDVVRIEIDGPESLLRQSTRYGQQMAHLLPVLVSNPGGWSLEAQVLWGFQKQQRALRLESGLGLRARVRDEGAWTSNAEQWFVERWEKLDTGWTLHPGRPIALGGQEVIVPDLSLRKGKREAHLDIVGYWRPGELARRVQCTPPDVVVAVSKRLCADKSALPPELADRVVLFAEIISAPEVLARVEQVARTAPRRPG